MPGVLGSIPGTKARMDAGPLSNSAHTDNAEL